MTEEKITSEASRATKAQGLKIAALTAYDFPMTQVLDRAGVPLIVVGDSVGMVVLGYQTPPITTAEMEHQLRAVAAQNRAD